MTTAPGLNWQLYIQVVVVAAGHLGIHSKRESVFFSVYLIIVVIVWTFINFSI